MGGDDDHLDLSWMKEYMQKDAIYNPEPMEHISLYFIYVNCDGAIVSVLSDTQSLHVIEGDGKSESVLSQHRILQIVDSKRGFLGKRYHLDDILTYNVSMRTEDMISCFQSMSFGEYPFSRDLVSHTSLPKDLHFPESIFIFHSLHGVWFVFHEMVLDPVQSTAISLKSCIRPIDGLSMKKVITKKVRISDRKTVKNRLAIV